MTVETHVLNCVRTIALAFFTHRNVGCNEYVNGNMHNKVFIIAVLCAFNIV